jgi:site-specific DNA-methyltransferase (adenine-specific)
MEVNEGGKGLGAIPLYHKFVQQAKKLNPRYIAMIIPSRWFSGGVGLVNFREEMLLDKHLKVIVDYINSNECFSGVDINGGINYFLWDNLYSGPCEFTCFNNGGKSVAIRNLNEFEIFVRHNEALSIIHKVIGQEEENMCGIVSSQTPFGFNSDVRGKEKPFKGSITLYSSKGVGYVSPTDVIRNKEWIPKYKVMMAKVTTEHSGAPGKDGKLKVLTPLKVIVPDEICTQSYLIVGPFDDINAGNSAKKYLETKFVRFLLQQSLSSMNISKDKFRFVPIQNFVQEWTDEKLYVKYGLTQEEIAFIESMIRPMEVE